MSEQERWDRFAAAALAGLLAAPSSIGENARLRAEQAAEWAAQFATALILESRTCNNED